MITISSDKLICDIQREFTFLFPFLKIEFFIAGSASGRRSGKHPYLPNNLKIGEVSIDNKEGAVCILENTTLKHLEKECAAEFSVFVQVYRRSGNIWLETSKTRSWTMKQQNDSGLELSVLLNKEE